MKKDMKDTKNKKVLEKASDIPKVQAPKKVANTKKKGDQDQMLNLLNEKLSSSEATLSSNLLQKAIPDAESDEKSILESTNVVENEPSFKRDKGNKQVKEKVNSLEIPIIEDFTKFSKEDLVTHIASLQKDINLKHISSSLRNLKVRIDALF